MCRKLGTLSSLLLTFVSEWRTAKHCSPPWVYIYLSETLLAPSMPLAGICQALETPHKSWNLKCLTASPTQACSSNPQVPSICSVRCTAGHWAWALPSREVQEIEPLCKNEAISQEIKSSAGQWQERRPKRRWLSKCQDHIMGGQYLW
jgi:hypothetical protein